MLETPRLVLRSWEERDREPFRRMNADPQVMEYFAAPLTPAESDAMIQRIEAHMERHGFGFFAAALRDTGELVGMVGMSHVPFDAHFTPCVEIGWRMAAAYWNRGLATEGSSRMPALCARGARPRGGGCVHCAGEPAFSARDGEARHDAESEG